MSDKAYNNYPLRPARIDRQIEIPTITVRPNEYIVVYLLTPANELHGIEAKQTRIECRVGPLGKHKLYCDDLDAQPFEELKEA